MEIGSLLKSIRLEKGLKLNEVANNAGIAVSSLSQMENEKISPSISTLSEILAFYNIPMSDFFMQLEQNDLVIIYDKENEEFVGKSDKSGIRMKLLASKLKNNVIESYKVVIPPGDSLKIRSIDNATNGERFIYMLGGLVTACFKTASYTLSAHDSLNYKSYLECLLKNESSEETCLIVSGTPYIV